MEATDNEPKLYHAATTIPRRDQGRSKEHNDCVTSGY